MFCSTIIPTVARPSLARAVRSVLQQDFSAEGFEVIVVNDSGSPLYDEDWHTSPNVRILETHRRERSVARNTGAAVAGGRFLHFLDDDDWLVDGALSGFFQLSQMTDAGWLYGDSQLVDRKGVQIIQLKPKFSGNCFVQVMAGEWIPLQASLIRSDAFFEEGGFHPLLHATQDIDLSRRIARRWDFSKLDQTVVTIEMGVEGSRTNYTKAPSYSRLGRESILEEPGVLARMLDSAKSPYWKGRIVRAFATSAIWNFENRKPLMAASRFVFALLSMILTFRSFGSTGYWKAVFRAYESVSFLAGFSAANKPVAKREIKDQPDPVP